MYLVLAGPILGRARLEAAGRGVSLGSAATFADIARSEVVDGANTTSAAWPR